MTDLWLILLGKIDLLLISIFEVEKHTFNADHIGGKVYFHLYLLS